MCVDGTSCKRKVCFFAHSAAELRHPDPVASDAHPGPDGLWLDAPLQQQQQQQQQHMLGLPQQVQATPPHQVQMQLLPHHAHQPPVDAAACMPPLAGQPFEGPLQQQQMQMPIMQQHQQQQHHQQMLLRSGSWGAAMPQVATVMPLPVAHRNSPGPQGGSWPPPGAVGSGSSWSAPLARLDSGHGSGSSASSAAAVALSTSGSRFVGLAHTPAGRSGSDGGCSSSGRGGGADAAAAAGMLQSLLLEAQAGRQAAEAATAAALRADAAANRAASHAAAIANELWLGPSGNVMAPNGRSDGQGHSHGGLIWLGAPGDRTSGAGGPGSPLSQTLASPAGLSSAGASGTFACIRGGSGPLPGAGAVCSAQDAAGWHLTPAGHGGQPALDHGDPNTLVPVMLVQRNGNTWPRG